MTALIVLASIAAVFILIGFIRVGVHVKYYDELYAAIKVAFKTIVLFPKREKPERPPKPEKPKKPKPEKAEKEEKKKEKPKQSPIEMLGGVRSILSLARDALSDLFGMIKTERLVVEFVSAKKEDPATVATNYGYACAVAGAISPLLDNNKMVSYYSIKLGMDYEAEKPTAAGELKFSVSVGRTVCFAVKYGVRVLKIILKNRKKGGAVNGKAGIEYA